jgi:hypothetical protein
MSIQNINEIPEITFDAFIGAMNLEKEFEAEKIVQETIECPICMDPIDGNKNSVVTECGHKFHCSCLMKNSCHNGFDCPMCRSAMVEDMEDDEEEEDDHEDDDGSYADDNSHADDNSDADEYDDEIHEIVIEDFDSLVEDICFYTNADFRRYPAENSVMIMLKITGNDDLMDDFDRHVVGEHTERIVKLIDIYKRTRILNDHFKKQAEKISEKKEQELFAQEDIKIEVVAEKPVMTVDESIQKIKHVLKEISELNSYAITLMKQVTPEIFHNKYQRTNISEFLKTLNLNKPRAEKNYFMENKNLIDEALNLLECKEKNE